jgi:phosphatidylglycerol lysyltransferase
MGSALASLPAEQRRRQAAAAGARAAHERPGDDTSPRGGRTWHWLGPGVALVLVALVAGVLAHELRSYSLADIVGHVAAIPRSAVALAVLCTAGSYACLTLFDLLGLRYLRIRLRYAQVALASFVAYSFSHNVSLAAFTGAGLRYRFHSAHGVGVTETGKLVLFCAATTALGVALLAGSSLLFAPPVALPLVAANERLGVAVGTLLLALPVAYLAWAGFARRPVTWRGATLAAPGLRVALPQLLLGVVELAFAAAVLWLLLPAGTRGAFGSFAGLYCVAIVAGVLSNVPGGLGVFETTLLLCLPAVPRDQMLGALLAYRGIYYLLPLAAAALLLGRAELRRGEAQGSIFTRIAQLYVAPVAPQLAAALVFLAGTVLLLSGATPAVDARLHVLRELVPLPLLELSHLAGSVAGLALLLLARGLQRRLAAAYHLTQWLLGLGIAASLLKGLDVEEALVLGAVLFALHAGRSAFYRPSRLLDERFSPTWIAAVLGVVALTLLVGLLSADTHYSDQLWWTFATTADVPRMLRASLAVAVLAAMLLAWHLLRPGRVAPHDAAGLDLERARRAIAVADESMANAALTGDKRLLFATDADAFVMYQISGRSWVALGDPVGPPEQQAKLAWAFRERVDRADGRAVFYQVSARNLPVYVDMGLTLTKLGEEARVALPGFNLEGAARAELRQAHRRARRAGATFEVLEPAAAAGMMPALRRISDEWLQQKATAEKGFSVGAFTEDYLRRLPVALVRLEGHPVAFANLWPTATREELSVDLMRFGRDAPRGSMDFLFMELMLWGRAEGYRWFNLGMAPLAGLEPHALAPAWHRMGRFVFRHGEHFYNFEGLRFYKDKFAPQWQPRYMASQGRLALPQALFDTSRLIAGGLRGLVAR